jgi:tRNA-(ms[2]io[6]A)-hydroxylase
VRREPHYLLDRLLLAAIIERRGHERFGLIADALEPGPERSFFQSITQSEGRHYQLFLDLAATYHPHVDLAGRADELCSREAEIIRKLPIQPRLH